jgi:hypothetical protein
VTVCTNHLAFGDLVEDGLPASIAQIRADAEGLIAHVVKLEDQRIPLA